MNHKEFLTSLETGVIRVAEKHDSGWVVCTEIKQRILDIFRQSATVAMPGGFFDKEPMLPRFFNIKDKVRIVPGGTCIRSGAFIGKHVVIMPPSYINIGAYVGDYTMVDSHVLVGSCAQIGKNVHLSAGVQIGGVLEPIGQKPVIIEDNCFIGAGVIITEGILICGNAVIAPGVVLSAAIPVYDIVNEVIYIGEIPSGAVVIPGTRKVKNSQWAHEQEISMGCAIITKYRDNKTNASLILESCLRS